MIFLLAPVLSLEGNDWDLQLLDQSLLIDPGRPSLVGSSGKLKLSSSGLGRGAPTSLAEMPPPSLLG